MARVVTAVDIGHSAMKIVALTNRAGMPELVGVGAASLDELGRVEDGAEKVAALAMRASRLAADTHLPPGESVTAVSGRTTMVRYLQIPPIPPWRLDALMRFEAEQQSFMRQSERAEGAPAEVPTHDYRMLDVPDVDGQSLVLLALSQEATVRERTDLARAAGAADPDVDLTSLGLFNAYVLGHGADEDMVPLDVLRDGAPGVTPKGSPVGSADVGPIDTGKMVALLDVGATELNMCIVRNGGLFFARHQPGGGRSFTEAIKDTLLVTWPQAEKYKRTKARVPAGPDEDASDKEKAVAEALSREAASLARTVEAGFMYARAQTKLRELKVERILLSGGGAALPGLPEFLARRLRTEVAPLEPMRKVSLGGLSAREMAPLEGEYCAFAVPLGLALARVSPVGARLDLRTSESKGRREFHKRGLFLWAASLVFAFGMIFWIADAWRDQGVYVEAREKAKTLELGDKAALGEFEVAKDTSDRLRAEIGALRERVTSGEDLLRALSQLKRRTPESIRLIEVSTTRPRVLVGEEAPDKEITFADQRMIWLTGYARSTKSAADAMREVFKYHRLLEGAGELFEVIRQVDLKTMEVEPGEPETAYFILAIRIEKPRW